MGTYDDRLARVVAEFGQAVQEYTAVAGGDSVDESPELAALEKRVRDTGWHFMPALYAWAWSRTQYDDPDMEKGMERIGEVLLRVSRVLVRHRDKLNSLTNWRRHQTREIAALGGAIARLMAENEDLRKRVAYLEASAVRNIPAPLPAVFDVPDWDVSFTADPQTRTLLTMLIGELRNRFAVPVAGGGEG